MGAEDLLGQYNLEEDSNPNSTLWESNAAYIHNSEAPFATPYKAFSSLTNQKEVTASGLRYLISGIEEGSLIIDIGAGDGTIWKIMVDKYGFNPNRYQLIALEPNFQMANELEQMKGKFLPTDSNIISVPWQEFSIGNRRAQLVVASHLYHTDTESFVPEHEKKIDVLAVGGKLVYIRYMNKHNGVYDDFLRWKYSLQNYVKDPGSVWHDHTYAMDEVYRNMEERGEVTILQDFVNQSVLKVPMDIRDPRFLQLVQFTVDRKEHEMNKEILERAFIESTKLGEIRFDQEEGCHMRNFVMLEGCAIITKNGRNGCVQREH